MKMINDFGVLDHHVTLSTGEEVFVPMRVIPNGSRSEVIGWKDLKSLKIIMERNKRF